MRLGLRSGLGWDWGCVRLGVRGSGSGRGRGRGRRRGRGRGRGRRRGWGRHIRVRVSVVSGELPPSSGVLGLLGVFGE